MSIWKKAVGVGTSAALLASLLITAAAPAALASITQTSAGNVAQGATSAGTATFLFTENSINALQTTGTMTVHITDSASGATVTWAGTPVVSAPDSLGASATIFGADLIISITDFDNANVETISITGLKVKAASNAATGAVLATLSDSAAGAIYGAFVGGTATATGKLAQAYGPTTTNWIVAVDSTSPCIFSGTNDVTVGSETLTVTSVSANNVPVAGQQTFVTSAMTSNHLANEVVSQTVANCTPTALGSPATVVQSLSYTSEGNPVVFPGEANSAAAGLFLEEPAAGFLAAGTVITYTLDTAGVVFSGTPSTDIHAGNIVDGQPVLSLDRKVVTITVSTASSVASLIHLYNIHYDVASTVPAGTFVSVTVTLSSGKIVTPTTNTNAVVFRGVTATASMPTVYIGENAQATGLVTIAEQDPAFFQSGTGQNNVLEVCPLGVNYNFTFAPWAKVTAGDLRLREGDVASPDNIVAGTQDGSCYYWTVWTGSTVASTIVIGDSTFATGPLINVFTTQAPGTVALDIYSGDGVTSFDEDLIATVGFATAVYRNQVVVTALSQPVIPAGSADVKVGDIQIAETAYGQLKDGEDICVEVLPRTSNNIFQDTYLKALLTADLPTVTASGGLVVSPVNWSERFCNGDSQVGAIGTHMVSFSFTVLQQSLSATGKLVIGNIHVITTADAPAGPVLFNVYGFGGSPTSLQFQSTVSPAKIGVAPKLNIGAVSALGLNPTSGYTTKTPKTQVKGKYVTWKFTGGTALAGQRVNVLIAKKINGAWGGPVYLKSAWADANGIVTFSMKSASAAAVNIRVQWPGSSTMGVSVSKALGAYWK